MPLDTGPAIDTRDIGGPCTSARAIVIGFGFEETKMSTVKPISPNLLNRFRRGVKAVEHRLGSRAGKLTDGQVDKDCRKWLDGDDEPLPWHGKCITPDEYFFITTLYGNMNLDQQRTMIRKFFESLFVQRAKRDIRNFKVSLGGYDGLRSDWMKYRICKMGALLRRRGISMVEYVDELRALDKNMTPENPMPSLTKIISDHGAVGVKTLSVFVRDCVRGNCFPIDLRVRKQLHKYGLPDNEGLLVQMSRALHKNPRKLARMFYEADWW
jgi:hypothetical protein